MSLSESYESLFFPSSSSFSRTVSFRQTHTHTSVSRGTFFKRCNFDARVCFAVSLDVGKIKEEYWTATFYFFFFFFFFLVFVFVMKGWREATKSCSALLLGPEWWCERGRECGLLLVHGR